MRPQVEASELIICEQSEAGFKIVISYEQIHISNKAISRVESGIGVCYF